ncbi:hypothetical protein EI94DRAFT_1745521 [Lactarius quietus]|nr:hypothetical protein EI94DRAFT_1745521 [Lactarius quietus]
MHYKKILSSLIATAVLNLPTSSPCGAVRKGCEVIRHYGDQYSTLTMSPTNVIRLSSSGGADMDGGPDYREFHINVSH